MRGGSMQKDKPSKPNEFMSQILEWFRGLSKKDKVKIVVALIGGFCIIISSIIGLIGHFIEKPTVIIIEHDPQPIPDHYPPTDQPPPVIYQQEVRIKEDLIENYIKGNKPFQILRGVDKMTLLQDQWERLTDYYLDHFYTNYSLETRNSSDPDFLDLLEAIANNWTYLRNWKNAYLWNLFLLYQEISTVKRFERVINDLNYTLDMWRSSEDFIQDSSAQEEKVVVAVVIDTGVRFRRGPGLENSIIRQFKLFEIIHVLGKSDFTESIEGANAYWMNIDCRDGTVGWVYGKYLKLFYPNVYWPKAAEIPDYSAILQGIKFPLVPH